MNAAMKGMITKFHTTGKKLLPISSDMEFGN